jgi:adenylate kinase family enzyme
MQRIMIIGSSGSGKSTLGRLLQEKTNLPLIHLDKHYWKPNWVEPSKEEWEAIQKPLAERDKLAVFDVCFSLSVKSATKSIKTIGSCST